MQLLSVNVGPSRDVDWKGSSYTTGIFKSPVEGPVPLRTLNLDGDKQVDLSVHGGPDRAVYAYPAEHYAFWQTVRAQAQVALWEEVLPFGSIGENLTLEGANENDVAIGDQFGGPARRNRRRKRRVAPKTPVPTWMIRA